MARPKKQPPQELLLPEPTIDHDGLIAQQLADYIREMVPTDALNELVVNAEGEFPQYRNDPVGFIGDILGITLTEQQKDVCKSVLGNRHTTVEAGHAVGKCQGENEPVILADGRVMLAKDLVDNWFAILGFDPSTWQMRPMLAHAEDNGIRDVLVVTMRSGIKIVRTPNHPLLTWHGWERLDQLHVGDSVAIPLCHPINIGHRQSREEIILAAYLISEGGTSQQGVYITQSKGVVQDEILHLIGYFGCEPRPGPDKITFRCAVSGNTFRGGKQTPNPISRLARTWELRGKRSSGKRVPPWVFHLPIDQLGLFLNRLYAGDGWLYVTRHKRDKCSNLQIGYASMSEGLVRDVRLLLLRFGIAARISHKKTNCGTTAWVTGIYDAETIIRFLDTIGAPLGKEEITTELRSEAIRRTSASHSTCAFDCLPKEAWKDFERDCRSRNLRRRFNIKPTRRMLRRYQEVTETIVGNNWVDSQIGWDEIVSIEPIGEQRTVAIFVPETNAYVTDVIEHNTVASAALGLWWVSTRNPATLLTSAPTFHQTNQLLWRNMRQYKNSARAQLPGIIFQTPRWEISPHRFGVGVSPRKATDVDVATMQGYHSPNLLVILDEAGGLTLPLWNVSMSLVTGEFNRFLAIGNPVARSGPFFDSTQQSSFHSIRISCLDHPNVLTGTEVVPGAVSRQWVEERINDWCHPTNNPNERSFQWKGRWYDPLPVFEARVLGRPPVEAEDQLIPLHWATMAQRPIVEAHSGERVLGLDVARHGSASSAIIYRVGDHVLWVKRQRGNDTTVTSDWLMAEIKENEADVAYIDEIGIGGACVDQCTRAGAPVQGVNVQRQAMQKTRFSNMRHELWWTVREKLRTGEMTLPFDDDLIADLTCIKYSFDPLGRIQVEEKEQTIKRLGRSPDAGDALALSYMGNVPGSTRESLNYATISSNPSGWYAGTSRWTVNSGRHRRSWKIS